jgi:hypothetical protein
MGARDIRSACRSVFAIDHAVHGVAAASTHTDDFYFGIVASLFVEADANVIFIFHG